MTTPPPTADGGLPAWLPDEATLSRMAGEFFRALPGASEGAGSGGVGGGGLDRAVPDGAVLDRAVLDRAVPGPASTATHGRAAAAPSGAPVGSVPGLPFAPSGVPAGSVPGLPASASAAPVGSVSPSPAPSTLATPATSAQASIPAAAAYYFLTEPSAHTASSTHAAPSAPPAPSPFAPFSGTAFGATVPSLAPPHLPLPAPSAPSIDAAPYYFVPQSGALAAGLSTGLSRGLPLDPHPAFDVHAIRRDFPILSELVHGRPLVWLDNAATTQKPRAVIDRLVEFYSRENSNIHRAAHELAARATDAYEGARRTVARFIGAGSAEQIVFVRGTTEAINLVANTWGRRNVRAGDEIVISHLEHHANIVPWQMLAQQTGAVIKVIPVDESGQLLLDRYADLLSDRTKLVAVTQLSNALGTVVPVDQMIAMAHRAGARVLVDAAQSIPHMPIDVTALDTDFLVFSGHKLFGPTGIGALYGKSDVLEDMPPWEGGGNMIADVTLERAVYQPPPNRFEAGTGNIADAAGLAAAIEYVERIGLPNIAAHEHALLERATDGLRMIPGLRLVGTAPGKASIASFVLDGYEPAEVGTALNQEGIAVRAGHHCAQPILRRYGLEATVRPSFAFYNTYEEVDALVSAVRRLADRRPRR